ncbi:hypothetical protein [Pasteurella canis]|uniref:hypothetical protein n=1 Tax=Pasteurella canis TaxID=753 RepID=UPI000D837CE6|nr:hypothetical protein [Pasteurella canis]SPY32411.1 Uncharacterised protein [Pasteurella canis]
MVRYRWYRLLTKKDIKYIYEKMQRIPFDDGKRKGVVIDSVSDKNISGIFYYVSLIMQDNASIDIINAVNFSISKVNNNLFLRVYNPSHSIKVFSDLLFDLCNFDLAFESISISFKNIEDWIDFRKLDATLNLVKVSNLKITEDIIVDITFKSDKELNLLDLDITKDKKYDIKSMSWTIFELGKYYKVLVSHTGLVTTNEYLALDIINYIETYILK